MPAILQIDISDSAPPAGTDEINKAYNKKFFIICGQLESNLQWWDTLDFKANALTTWPSWSSMSYQEKIFVSVHALVIIKSANVMYKCKTKNKQTNPCLNYNFIAKKKLWTWETELTRSCVKSILRVKGTWKYQASNISLVTFDTKTSCTVYNKWECLYYINYILIYYLDDNFTDGYSHPWLRMTLCPYNTPKDSLGTVWLFKWINHHK